MAVSIKRTYFLSVQTWTEYGFTNTNTDEKKLLPVIFYVQKNTVEPILGTTLYNRLSDDVVSDNVSGIYKKLLDDFIIPLMIPACDLKATFHTTSQITNKTTGKNSDEHIQANDRNDNNELRDELSRDILIFERNLKNFLRDNWENIPELVDAPDADMLAQTISPDLKKKNDMNGFLSII